MLNAIELQTVVKNASFTNMLTSFYDMLAQATDAELFAIDIPITHYAITRDNVTVLKVLLNRKLNPDVLDENGDTVLDVAVRCNKHIEMVLAKVSDDMILAAAEKAFANYDYKVFCNACKNSKKDFASAKLFNTVIAKGDIGQVTCLYENSSFKIPNALSIAAEKDDATIVCLLHDKYNERFNDVLTAVMDACTNGRLKMVCWFAATDIDDITPECMLSAARNGHLNIVEFLSTLNVPWNYKDVKNVAEMSQKQDIVDFVEQFLPSPPPPSSLLIAPVVDTASVYMNDATTNGAPASISEPEIIKLIAPVVDARAGYTINVVDVPVVDFPVADTSVVNKSSLTSVEKEYFSGYSKSLLEKFNKGEKLDNVPDHGKEIVKHVFATKNLSIMLEIVTKNETRYANVVDYSFLINQALTNSWFELIKELNVLNSELTLNELTKPHANKKNFYKYFL